MGYWMDGVQIGSRDHPASYTMGVGVLSPGIKRQEHEDNHSPPVKNHGAIHRLHDVGLNSLWAGITFLFRTLNMVYKLKNSCSKIKK
jgi:hypothetical protein